MSKKKQNRPPRGGRWAVFGAISAVYFFAYFHRVSTSVIAPDLLAAFDVNATALGFMSSMYFYLYAFEQPVVGYLADRWGPRWVVAGWTLVAALGCFLFGMAPSIEWASVGRALIGFGVGGVFVPGMKAFSQWFRVEEFATLTGTLLALGNLGAIVATTPLAWAAQMWGWRGSFMVIGAITLGLALGAFLLIGNPEPKADTSLEKGPSSEGSKADGALKSILQIFSSLRFWILGIIFFGAFGTYLTFQGLWATTFLMALLGLDLFHASMFNMLVPIGLIVGAPFTGWISNRFHLNKGWILIGLLVLETGLWACMVFGGKSLGHSGILFVLFILGGASGGLGAMLWGLVRETTPTPILGLTTGLLNPFPFVGVAIYQVWTGAILDRSGRVDGIYPVGAYQDSFLLCLLTVAICLGLALFFQKTLTGGNECSL
ncbi:MAG TPA: MFS transporter [Deltaproteobacteria bacterium]|nr:MFS transporter [Deltaproteobacteria bacterium]